MTAVEYLEKFAQYLNHNKGLSSNSVTSYVSDLKPLLTLYPHPEKLTLEQIQRYFKKLTDQGISARSVSRKMSAVKLFFNFCTETGLFTQNPTAEIKPLPFHRALPQVLSQDEAQALLESPTRPVDTLILRMLYATGMRVSELVGLRISDMDLQTGVFRVLGKGNKTRMVPVDPETTRLIQTYLKEIREPRARKKKTNVFLLSQQGAPFTRQAIWKIVKKYATQEALGQALSPHDLRHAFATHLMEGGMGLRPLQMLLGHSDVSTTEIYTHVSNQQLQKTVREFHPKAKAKAKTKKNR